jgi:protein-glucosylgalactosylhydroxylysine glucosidase
LYKTYFNKFRMKKPILLLSVFLLVSCFSLKASDKIDRHKLVTRHNIENSEINPLNSLTVGNGEFAYTADITGMQTFPEYYERGISLGTESQWGWHSFPNPEKYSYNEVIKKYKVGNDSIPYIFQFSENDGERKFNASEWLRSNSHRLHLGMIGLDIEKKNSQPITIKDISEPKQKLNLWTGELSSYFEIEGVPVEVTTLCHQQFDMLSFKIKSALIKKGLLKLKVSFLDASNGKFSPGYDLVSSGQYTSSIFLSTYSRAIFKRLLDSTVYYVQFDWKGLAKVERTVNQAYIIKPSGNSDEFEVSVRFEKNKGLVSIPSFTETVKNNIESWRKFWESGAAVDFSECSDSRAEELERRVVLSQYLTKVQCSGSLPPQETGLTSNSWFGKFHLEMHWWNAAHFIQWGRAELMEKQLDYYFSIFEKAKITAQFQGYEGARWPKMTDPEGNESPSTIGTFLIWQQPHLIYFAEMLYRYHNNDIEVLRKFQPLVEATADFMASYARWDQLQGRYVLGPALIPAQECFDPETTINPAFELAYWRWALLKAQSQRVELGLGENEKWQHVIDNLSPLPIKDNLYLFTENATDSYTNPLILVDHPMVLGVAGFLPISEKIDKKILKNTLDTVIKKWDWNSAWGWDFPMAAMCATVLDEPEQALNLLMKNTYKNRYLMNGHNYQDDDLPLYLPGNGSLLSAVAFMCTYRNEKGENGFPSNGKWTVRYEDFPKGIE